jgi:hypothetical protein
MSEQVAEVVNPSVEPTPAEMKAKVSAIREQYFLAAGDGIRQAKAAAKGLLDPSIELSPEELRALIPLEGDTMRYAVYPKGHPQAGEPRLALRFTRDDFIPKPHGRKNKHMSKRNQAIKSAYLRISKDLFTIAAGKKIKAAEADGTEFVGLSQDDMTKIAAKAARLGTIEVIKTRRFQRNVRNRVQQLSRGINAGLLPGGVNARNFAYSGGQFGN